MNLHREVLRIRLIEEAIATAYSQQKMRCPVHLSIGQEAVAVGVCAHLKKTDKLVSNHRAHAHYLAKGGDLKRMVAEIHGKATGCCKGRGGSMHLIDLTCGMIGCTPIVGSSLPVGVGLSFAAQLKKEPHLTLVFIGDGATEEGVFAECLNFASLRSLPLLFVCENNFYSVYSPLSVRQSEKRDLLAIARAHGIYVDSGNGNDVEEVFQVSKKAIDHLREKKGPALLSFTTYRHREHCGPNFDNHIGYRTTAEYESWLKECPVAKIPLEQRKLWTPPIQAEIAEAFHFAETSPWPEEEGYLDP